MSELKPCPFSCGTSKELVIYDPNEDEGQYVMCTLCGTRGPYEPTREMAIEEWNTRATLPARWLKAEEVREGGTYWWLQNDEWANPVSIYVMKSGTDGSCFASAGQLGWWKAMQLKELGGLWQRIPEPVLPEGE